MKPQPDFLSRAWRLAAQLAALALALAAPGAFAAATDISNAPLFTSSSSAVKPNIMFIFDDSISMKYDYLPDEANFSTKNYGRYSAQCNGVAYDPNIVYTLPVDANGNSVAPGSTSFITPTPTTQTTNQRNISGSFNMPESGSTITLTLNVSSPQSSWYEANDEVVVFSSNSKYFTGSVVSWNKNTKVLVVLVDATVGSGSLSSAKVGDGPLPGATYYVYTGSEPRLGYKYTSSGVDKTTTFYKQCNSQVGYSPGKDVFTPVTVNTLSPEAQNYANWYQYYSTRLLMMKSSVTLAFKGMDTRYRLGYSTISETKVADGNNFLNIRPVDATQKQKFYAAVNAASTVGYTPLRGALSKAGRYYAKKASGQTIDPVEYSCQRNFTILSTDGYWNAYDEDGSYGPYGLDGALVGQQDGGATLRPMYDGGQVLGTTTETWTVTTVTTATGTTPKTTTSTVTRGTTTVAPIGSQEQYVYTATSGTVLTMNGNSGGNTLQRPASGCGSASNPCWVTVTFSVAHGLTSGDAINVSGGNVAGYRGDFSGADMVVINATTIRYKVSSRPNAPGSSNYTLTPAAAASCSVGQFQTARQRQVRDVLGATTITQVTTTTTLATTTQSLGTTTIQPMKRVITTTNGVVTSDTTTPGTATNKTNNGPATTVTGTPVVTVDTDTSGPTANGQFTPWVNSGSATSTGCRSDLPAASPNGIAGTTTSYFQRTTFGPTNAGPSTRTDPTIVSDVVSTPTETARVSNTSTKTSGGSQNSLADVAMYYYNTDLRNSALGNCNGALGSDVCNDNVPGNDDDAAHSYGDKARWQHMTTFTLGLGLSGTLNYVPDYLTVRSGDYYDITNNNKNWPVPGDGKSAENIDDLWHAAVNGRGQYFSAGDPQSLARGLNSALESIKMITGSASAASTSSLQPVEGDNDIYVAQFTTQKWTGDVLSFRISPTTGLIDATATWSAAQRLDAVNVATRKIWYSNGTKTLRDFNAANLSADGKLPLFQNFCTKPGAGGAATPEQCATLSTGDTTAANTAANLVNYLRGDQSMPNLYRNRDHLLGDIINASPLFVGKPNFKYTENGYQTFQSANANRDAVVLAAANDGMLHAFDRVTGDERWAFMPSFVLPNLYKLADTAYANNHQFYVDGSPQIGDIYVDDGDGKGFKWKTIVVGGMNAGGKGYYALDVTDPVNPKLMWEYTDTHLGLTFGNPIITKRKDGTWVVVFGSGYNNHTGGGDGKGRLYVLNANTGSKITTIDTGAGDTTTPSGLAKVNAWVESEVVNEAQRFYAGDLLGNVWRFDLDNKVEPKGKALLLARLTTPSGTAQSVTVKPALAEVSYNSTKYPVVFVPTGRYLGTSDLSDLSVQSLYAIKDPLADVQYGVVRSNSTFVSQTLNDTGNAARTGSTKSVDWSTKSGWYVDFPGSGERVSVNPQMALNTLYVGTNKPNNDACTVGGDSFLYQFDIVNGTSTSNYVGNVLIQGLTLVQLTTGAAEGSVVTIITRSDGTLQTQVGTPASAALNLRRTSWRELVE